MFLHLTQLQFYIPTFYIFGKRKYTAALTSPHTDRTRDLFSHLCLAQGRGVARDEQSLIVCLKNSTIFRAHTSLLFPSQSTPSHTSSTSPASWTPSVNYPNLRVCEHLYLWGGTRRKRAEKNKSLCVANSASVSEYARTFSKGHWSFLGPGCKEKWCGTHTQTRRWMESCC